MITKSIGPALLDSWNTSQPLEVPPLLIGAAQDGRPVVKKSSKPRAKERVRARAMA